MFLRKFPLSSGMRSEQNIGLLLSATVTVPTNHMSPSGSREVGLSALLVVHDGLAPAAGALTKAASEERNV